MGMFPCASAQAVELGIAPKPHPVPVKPNLMGTVAFALPSSAIRRERTQAEAARMMRTAARLHTWLYRSLTPVPIITQAT